MVVSINEANNEGYWPNGAQIDIYSNQALRDEFAAAANLGGTLSFTVHVRTADLMGATPGYLPGYFGIGYLVNSQSGYTADFTNYIGGYQPDGTITTTVQVPIVPVGAGGGVGNSTLEYFAASTYNQISVGLNTSKFADGFRGSTVYIDDFIVAANTVESPPPILAITPAVPGLNLISSGGGQYDRQLIRTADGGDYSWVGKATPATPVTYALTIKDLPPGAGYESCMYLIPGTGLGLDSAPDYAQPDGIQLQVYPNGDGSGSLSFRYKVDSPNSNGPSGREYYATDLGDGIGGQITNVYSPQVLGTWKCNFTSDTDFTLTGPSGATSVGAINANVVDDFTGPMYVYFGSIPSQTQNVGLAGVYSKVQISGTPSDLNEDFSVVPFTSTSPLERSGSVNTSIVQVTPEIAKYFLNWTLPAQGYLIEQSTDLGLSDPWVPVSSTGSYPTKFGRSKLLLISEVQSE